jgi:hypothetical protein
MTREDSSAQKSTPITSPDSILTLLGSANEEVLRELVQDSILDETHVCLLLERKELSNALLELIAKQKTLLASYRVRRALTAHPHTPRGLAMRLLRELHLMDLVQMSLSPSCPQHLRVLADERILAQLPQLPLAQRMMLARRASARVAGGLLAQGPDPVSRLALNNPFLVEAQVLKALSREGLPARIVALIAKHEKWATCGNVRVALLRHPRVPLDIAAEFLPDLTRHDLDDLLALSRLAGGVRSLLRRELARRERR